MMFVYKAAYTSVIHMTARHLREHYIDINTAQRMHAFTKIKF